MLFVLAALMASFSAFADEPAVEETAVNDDMPAKIKAGNSFAPILGYDPTYGVLWGAAYFRGRAEPPVNNGSILLYASFHGDYATEVKAKLWDRGNFFYEVESTLSGFYDSYFGEGSRTDPKKQQKIQVLKWSANPAFGWRFSKELTGVVLAELRGRDEKGTPVFFGDEFTPDFGMALLLDRRNNEMDPTGGDFFKFRIDGSPKSMSSRAGAASFARIVGEYRVFVPTLGAELQTHVIAAQLKAGATVGGDPGYLYRFSLGGSRDLRGYQANRLRGREFYEAQVESRYSVLPWFGVAAFLGAGDVADQSPSDFSTPKLAGGVGLRIGLPPDFVAKARLDFGFSRDEKAFYLNFNEAF